MVRLVVSVRVQVRVVVRIITVGFRVCLGYRQQSGCQ